MVADAYSPSTQEAEGVRDDHYDVEARMGYTMKSVLARKKGGLARHGGVHLESQRSGGRGKRTV